MAASHTRPIRLSAELVNKAEQEAAIFQRSIAGQVEYWARLGQAFESAPGFNLERVKLALAGKFDAGALDAHEQVYFEDAYGDALATPTAEELPFFAQCRQAGLGVGYDGEGKLVQAVAGGGVAMFVEPKDARG